MESIRVVVADDDRDSAEVFGLLIRTACGCAVTVCYDGKSCLEAIRRIRPLAAFVDLQMPNMDGAAVARAIRAEDLPVFLIALTGYGGERFERLCREAGFDQHELKPISIPRILELLEIAAHKREVAFGQHATR